MPVVNNTKPKKLFGTDGVRGRANQEPMTVENALALGRAAGIVFRRNQNKHRVVIGKDTRLSCYMFENALISGLCSMGIDTLMVGPLPTPGVAFITRAYRADAGVVISASHNKYWDNGIKFFSRDGFKLPDSVEQEIESLVFNNHFQKALPKDSEIGKNYKIHDADGRYIEFAKATFIKGQSLKDFRIFLDCSNGAGFRVAPLIFRELDAKVITHGTQPDGLNINDGCGSLHPSVLQKGVLEHSANVGIALDGDADRVVMADENGQIVDGDTILAICALDLKRRGELKNDKVCGTVMSNFGFLRAMKENGIEVVKAKVGDRYVIQKMTTHGLNLGGEQSGHLIFLDHNTTGDGIVSALQVLRIMQKTGTKLSELSSIIKRYPQTLINVSITKKPDLIDLKEVEQEVKSVENELGDMGRVLIRYSGTEMICRVMVEGPRQVNVDQFAKRIAKKVELEIGS